MRQKPGRRIVWDDTTGGRNDTDPPIALRANQCVEMLNVDWKDTRFAHKRGGATSLSLTGGTAFSTTVATLIHHLPGTSYATAELWAVADVLKRLAAGTTWADVSLADAISGSAQHMVGVSFNSKLYLAYDSAQDRLHVYEATAATVRRVGIAPGSNAPTVANTGAGAYAATLRYYRVRWLINHGGTFSAVVSEPTPSVSFTPSGAGTAARVTRPTAPGEGETHWIVEASTDNSTFYTLTDIPSAAIVLATTTYDDSATVATYPNNDLSYQSGLFNRWPSVKYLLTDGNRLLGAGAWETSGSLSGGKQSRVWFSPVLGSLDAGDDERIVNTTTQKNWVDLNENDGGGITGLGGPLNGVIIAFKQRQVWKLRPTGDVLAPYLPRKIRDDIGCISHKSIALGEDQNGHPALYFLSHRGPYRVTHDGRVEYLGRDNEVTWRSISPDSGVNVVGHSVYYPLLHQWWLWITAQGETDPAFKMVFDVQKGVPDENGLIRGGWVKHTGNSAVARCSVMFATTPGASMSLDQSPYIGRASGVAIWKLDTSALDDAGTDFQAYVKGRPVVGSGELGTKVGMDEPYLAAKVLTGVTITMTSDRDHAAETRTHTQTLTAAGTETRVFKKMEGGEVGEADVIQLQIGDGSAQEGQWTLDAVVVPIKYQEEK